LKPRCESLPRQSGGSIEAEFVPGSAYELGRGVPKDMRQARAWMTKAAAAGSDEAQKWLASH